MPARALSLPAQLNFSAAFFQPSEVFTSSRSIEGFTMYLCPRTAEASITFGQFSTESMLYDTWQDGAVSPFASRISFTGFADGFTLGRSFRYPASSTSL